MFDPGRRDERQPWFGTMVGVGPAPPWFDEQRDDLVTSGALCGADDHKAAARCLVASPISFDWEVTR
jgi:hypothetical protein